MPEKVSCEVCGSKALKKLNSIKIEKIDADIPQKFLDMVKCRECGLIFVSPQPELSKELYNHEYFNREYMQFYSENSRENAVQSNEPFAWRMSLIEKYKKSGKLLDIGCANGGFLQLAKSKGWDTFGVEASDYAAQEAAKKDVNVFHGFLGQANFGAGFFDLVFAGDILEHLQSPVKFLEEIKRILKDDGLLYLAFPNSKSFYYWFFGALSRFNQRNYFVLPHHLYHFNAETIEKLLNKAGFVIEKLIYSNSRNKNILLNIFNIHDRIVLLARKNRE